MRIKITTKRCVIILCAFCITFGIIITLLAFCDRGPRDYYIFSDISECENIIQKKSEDATIEKYDMPDKDKNLKDLQYSAFFAAKYSSSELTFEIFAYEFQSEEEAQQYFERTARVNSDRTTNFLEWGNLRSNHIVVVDQKNAYLVNATRKDAEKLKTFLGEVFSKQIISNGISVDTGDDSLRS